MCGTVNYCHAHESYTFGVAYFVYPKLLQVPYRLWERWRTIAIGSFSAEFYFYYEFIFREFTIYAVICVDFLCLPQWCSTRQ